MDREPTGMEQVRVQIKHISSGTDHSMRRAANGGVRMNKHNQSINIIRVRVRVVRQDHRVKARE